MATHIKTQTVFAFFIGAVVGALALWFYHINNKKADNNYSQNEYTTNIDLHFRQRLQELEIDEIWEIKADLIPGSIENTLDKSTNAIPINSIPKNHIPFLLMLCESNPSAFIPNRKPLPENDIGYPQPGAKWFLSDIYAIPESGFYMAKYSEGHIEDTIAFNIADAQYNVIFYLSDGKFLYGHDASCIITPLQATHPRADE